MGWKIDKILPDKFDLIGGAIPLIGVMIVNGKAIGASNGHSKWTPPVHCKTDRTSQLPLESWHNFIADGTLTDAILDRLVHNANKIDMKGKSMRK